MRFAGPHDNLLGILHTLRGQRRRSSRRILESCTASGNHIDQLGVPNILYHGYCYGQNLCCYPDGQTYAAESMAKMDPLLPVHLHLHSFLYSHHLHLCSMLAAKGALDPWGGQVLEPQKSERSRRGACKCVPGFCDSYPLADIGKRLGCVCGFCSCSFWDHHDLESTDRSERKGRSMQPSRLGNLVRDRSVSRACSSNQVL